jgi:hypothetical protein
VSKGKVNQELLNLLSQVVSKGATGSGCFYARLNDTAKEFIDACCDVVRSGRVVSAEKIRDVLAREFNVQASEKGVRRHIKEACQCPRSEKTEA